jgi:hypothetical protein
MKVLTKAAIAAGAKKTTNPLGTEPVKKPDGFWYCYIKEFDFKMHDLSKEVVEALWNNYVKWKESKNVESTTAAPE